MGKYKISIELKSDLCMGSGYSYAGTIDSEAVFDKYGLPYIPAKRLKGCFRETANELLKYEEPICNRIFGEKGSSAPAEVYFSNGYLRNYTKLQKDADYLVKECGATKETIMEQFSSVRAQTSMEDGVAKEDTLRFIRVINPENANGNNLVFEADVECSDDLKSYVENIVMATRNIGMNRNRGLGSVKCSLSPSEKNTITHEKRKIDDNKRYKISFDLVNIQPLVISAGDDNKTEDFINGASLRGALAARYLKKNGGSADDKFNKIFLEDTIFNNILPANDNEIYYPAPLFLRKLKKTKDYVIISDVEGAKGKSEKDPGNRPKKLHGEYVNLSIDDMGCQIDIASADSEVVYHNSNIKSENDRLLYTLEVIPAGNKFKGSIVADGKNAEILCSLLEDDIIYFGKSKSSQYGGCRIEKVETKEYQNEKVKVKEAMLSLCSDLIIRNEAGNYSTNRDDLEAILIKKLGSKENEISIHWDNTNEPVSFLETTIEYGYNTKWNLQRPSVEAVKAGSCIQVSFNTETEVPEEFYLGENNAEGYGKIRVYDNAKLKYLCQRQERNASNEANQAWNTWLVDSVKYNILSERILNSAFGCKIKVTPSTLGRITLMLRESRDEKDYSGFLKDFEERIKSIKSDNARNEAIKFKKIYTDKFNNDIKTETIDENKKNELLYRYLMNLLVYAKYNYKNRVAGKGEVND